MSLIAIATAILTQTAAGYSDCSIGFADIGLEPIAYHNAFTGDLSPLLAGPSGLVPLNPRYQKPYDFGVPILKVIDCANQVAKAVYQKVDHVEGKSAAYWRDKTFQVVDETIKGFDFTPRKDLRDYLLAHGANAFVRSTFSGESASTIPLPDKFLNLKRVGKYADAWLRDADPRGGCASTNFTLLFFYEGVVGSDRSACGTGAIGEAWVRPSELHVTQSHTWVWLRIGSPESGFILQSDPHWARIPRSEKKFFNGVTDWGTILAGWLPATTEVFMATHWMEMSGKHVPYANGYLPPNKLSWSPMSSDQWRKIDWNAYNQRKRVLDAYDLSMRRASM